MASAAQGVDGAAPAASAKGGGKGKLLLVGLPVLLLAGAGGAYFAGVLPIGAAAEKAKAEEHAAEEGEKKAANEKKAGALRALDPFIANLADEDLDRYIKTTVQVEFLTPEVPEVFDQRLPQIRDLVLTLLTDRTFEDIRTPDGKERLREDVIDRVNHALEREAVRTVYFTEFIVQ